ncbi:MAG: RagB/SusD family nutrient uptake outer membrane protein [Prevotella sp.]|nr:RagB/SusD family nutrient uptake outer membrane protein [Prevotella sp.]
MKNKIKLSIMALSLVGFASCEMEAPSQSALDAQSIYSNEGMAEQAVMSIHQSFSETNSYRGRFTPYYGLNTDVEWINTPDATKTPDGGKNDLCAYNATPTNSQMNTDNNAYAKFYEGIERANLAISGLRTYGNVGSNSTMAQLLGEAITLRAVIYLDLVKGWGDVPARFEPASAATMYLGRTDRDSIYLQLLDDLKEAEDLVGWPNENSKTSSVERVNKAFVKALRARIALYAGGYSYRADQTVRLSNIIDRNEMYTIARDECVDIIKQGCNKLGDFKTNFENLCKDITTAGGESIWEIPFSDGRGRVLYTFGVKHNFTVNTESDQYTAQPQGGVNGPVPTLFYDYDVDDVRRDITCVPYEWGGISDKDAAGKGITHQQLRSLNKWCFGKLRYEWMNRYVTSTNDDGVNFQYMRYADVLMMAAEAENELNGPSNAAQYLKPVLDRALPAAKVNALMSKYTASKDAFFQGIVEQRAFEFAGEMLRKADLVRWNIIDSKLAETQQKMRELRSLSGAYADLPSKLYTKYADDGETLIIYGLNHGDTDAIGATLQGYDATTWISETKITDANINGLYINQPSTHAIWPIWQTFINSSNGYLNNAWLGF